MHTVTKNWRECSAVCSERVALQPLSFTHCKPADSDVVNTMHELSPDIDTIRSTMSNAADRYRAAHQSSQITVFQDVAYERKALSSFGGTMGEC